MLFQFNHGYGDELLQPQAFLRQCVQSAREFLKGDRFDGWIGRFDGKSGGAQCGDMEIDFRQPCVLLSLTMPNEGFPMIVELFCQRLCLLAGFIQRPV